MAKPELTRATRRARRPTPIANRVYGLTVEDAGADNWESQVVFFAESADQAIAQQKAAGFFKRNSVPMPAEQAQSPGFAVAAETPGRMYCAETTYRAGAPGICCPRVMCTRRRVKQPRNQSCGNSPGRRRRKRCAYPPVKQLASGRATTAGTGPEPCYGPVGGRAVSEAASK